MEHPRHSSSQQLSDACIRLARLAAEGSTPTRAINGSRRPEAWFLGLKGENDEMLERMVLLASPTTSSGAGIIILRTQLTLQKRSSVQMSI
jgi:hypothetical protein